MITCICRCFFVSAITVIQLIIRTPDTHDCGGCRRRSAVVILRRQGHATIPASLFDDIDDIVERGIFQDTGTTDGDVGIEFLKRRHAGSEVPACRNRPLF